MVGCQAPGGDVPSAHLFGNPVPRILGGLGTVVDITPGLVVGEE
jgi:hypothetical protein